MVRVAQFISGFFIGLLLLVGQETFAYAEVTGATVSEEITLGNNLTCDTPASIIVEGPGGRINLGGHTVSCQGGDNTIGIFLIGDHAKVTNGTVANCKIGVVAADKGHHRIIEVKAHSHSEAGFSTNSIGTFEGSNENWFISNQAAQSNNGFLISGNANYLFRNTSSENERGFTVNHQGNKVTLNVASKNGIGFMIRLGAEENHFIKNIAEENAFAGFEIEGNRNRLVNNRAIGNGQNMVDAGFRIIDAHDNFLGWNQSENNTGMGFEIRGFYDRSVRNILRGNLAQGNEQVGIALQLLAENNTLIENTGKGNGNLDLQDVNPDCDDNTWIDNTFDKADPEPCIR